MLCYCSSSFSYSFYTLRKLLIPKVPPAHLAVSIIQATPKPSRNDPTISLSIAACSSSGSHWSGTGGYSGCGGIGLIGSPNEYSSAIILSISCSFTIYVLSVPDPGMLSAGSTGYLLFSRPVQEDL